MPTPQGTVEECNRCGADIIWISTFKGKRMPIDTPGYDDGDEIYDRNKHSAHFDTCGDRKERPTGTRPQQGMTLDAPIEKAMLAMKILMKNGKPFEEAAKLLLQECEKNWVPQQSQQEEAFDDDIPF